MKMKKLGLLLMLLCTSFAMHAQELKKGDKLPDFQLKSSVYGDVSSADLKGKVVLVSLFATWCGPCQLELAEVQKMLWPKYKDNKDFVLLVIGREHTDEQLRLIMSVRNLLSRCILTLSGKFFHFLQKNLSLVRICLIRKEKQSILLLDMKKRSLII